MLYADKVALENRTKVRLLAIRERELTLYTNNCRAVGTVAALMAGLAFSSLIYTKMSYFKDSHEFVKMLYCLGNTVCMCMSLDIVLATTTVTMLGPGLALRGPDGSMHKAVDNILSEFNHISKMFGGTIFAWLGVLAIYAFTLAAPGFLGTLTVLALVGLIAYVMSGRREILNVTFPLRHIPLVSGAFFTKGSADEEEERERERERARRKQQQLEQREREERQRQQQRGGYVQLCGDSFGDGTEAPHSAATPDRGGGIALMADRAPPLPPPSSTAPPSAGKRAFFRTPDKGRK